MNDLEKYFEANTERLIHKWHHYFEIYDRHFSKFRGKEVHIVEFGTFQGGSLQMWKDYFGEKCKITSIDINPHCKKLEEDQIKVIIGDQDDRSFLKKLSDELPKIDILIDDGGHTMQQQINTFEMLFDSIDENGVYLIEDLHTSYWTDWDGGYKKDDTFIEYSKNFIDYINAWHTKSSKLKVNSFTKSVHSLHFYDSILAIEKRKMSKPTHSKTGTASIPEIDFNKSSNVGFKRFKENIKRKIRASKK